VSAFLFDAHATFTRIFEDPAKYGFPADAGQAFDGHMYGDHIHPKSAVHAIVAKEIGEFLSGKPLV
jgi:phospholipase/lecithinase/hemolysin